jgi:isoquinoline 1-oxidoreductase beta subunit
MRRSDAAAAPGEGKQPSRGISRRTLLVGGGVGVGLALAFSLWPRRYAPNLLAGEGETILNAFLKIGADGRVIVAVPQAELGQGVSTALPQILADELGADWRMVGVEPAPLNPIYANQLLAEELSQGSLPEALSGVRRWTAQEAATRGGLMLTGGSTSVRAFEKRLREAGAAARALLSIAAARRWDADWRELDAHGGSVWRGAEAIGFGDLAEAAASERVPADLPIRAGLEHRLMGQPLPASTRPARSTARLCSPATFACPTWSTLRRAARRSAAGSSAPTATLLTACARR